ncbi:MAG: sodium:calcium antiporter [Proteobacteria bacterium]|nr:sodium:calcium antiporter [Pseudomonadota bacterium]NCV45623.1 sodium:calcium antiporter [Pseudomonadota bacterium]NCV99376.1 sodium:calcium antiporter [Pseudomonadota bacterium]NCW10772.1 sodium:calcium antiporter [Pseudomonadota bacterium]NCW37584.1 sodium:calcium antiporter [Pseudomonadota bacterium]
MIFYHLIGLIISLSVLIWGADKFIDNSSLIAKKLGLSELTIGLTIVALGTSAPEIFVGISSVLNGTESIAMGAVVGSNISNIALIFGVSCIGISMQPAKTNPMQFIPFILAVIVLGLGLQDLKITKAESIEFLFVFAAFMYFTYLFRIPDKIDESDNSNIKTGKTTLLLIFGLLALIVGSNYAVVNAENIATILNVPQVIIGLTIIAIGTSLPELAATISAIVKNKNDMVIGNVIGSNVMNIALVVPIIGMFSDVTFESNILSRDFLVLSITSMLFILITATYSSSRFNLKVVKLIGYIFVIGYLGYIVKLSNLI